ncbi:MAG: hypothetical protein P8179_11530 [Candidatus Thiodiazotropha sp.]
MERIATIDVLRNWGQDNVGKLVSILNRNGIVSDEDGLGLSSTMIEAWDEDCDAYLAENGYQGGTLETAAEFISDHGAVYVIYDSESITYEKAKKYIESYAPQRNAI